MKTKLRIANDETNRGNLARDMVDSWDDKDLYQFAVDSVEENLANCNDEEFNTTWNDYYGEDA